LLPPLVARVEQFRPIEGDVHVSVWSGLTWRDACSVSIDVELGPMDWLNAFCTSWTSGVSEFHETLPERVVPSLLCPRREGIFPSNLGLVHGVNTVWYSGGRTKRAV
jgi:hypothetical protein